MKLTVNQQDLSSAATRVNTIVSSGKAYEIEEFVLIEASGEVLSLRSTSGSMEAVAETVAEVEQPGSTVVKGELLLQIARRAMQGVPVVVTTGGDESDENRMTLRAGVSEYHFDTRDVDEFPPVADDDYDTSFVVPGADLMYLIEKTLPAISKEESRYYLTGIFMHPFETDGVHQLVAAATDGHRLMRAMVSAEEAVSAAPGIIVPDRTVGVLRRVLSAGDSVTVAMARTKVRFSFKDFTLVSPVIDGTYPEYEKAIPDDCEISMTVEKKVLEGALSRATAICSMDSERVSIQLSKDSATFEVSNHTGQSKDTVPVVYQGPEMDFALQANHLRDAVAQISGDEFTLEMADARSRMRVTERQGDAEALCVLVPHRA